jgi:lysine 6-dehydrogenase
MKGGKTMKVLVLGAGKIGPVVAWDLAKRNEVELVGVADVQEYARARAKNWINSDKIVLHSLDVTNKQATQELMQKYDVGVITLPTRKTSYKAVETAIEARLNVVDILEEYHRRPDPYEQEGLELLNGMHHDEYGEWLHARAIEKGVTVLDGLGLAPGLSNVTLGEGIRKMDQAESAIARVGGIPAKEAARRHPLGYMITWSFEHVLREYMIGVQIIQNGKVVETPAMSGHDSFRFTEFGKDEELECFITPGMPSFIHTRQQLKDFVEKTIRWPGHWQRIQVLKECRLLDLGKREFEIGSDPNTGIHYSVEIKPRAFLSAALEPWLKPQKGDTDICVMWNTVTGTKNGKRMKIHYYMWDEADTENGISSMARTTAFTAAAGAILLGSGEILKKGIMPPEDCIEGALYKKLMSALRERNVRIREVPKTIQ